MGKGIGYDSGGNEPGAHATSPPVKGKPLANLTVIATGARRERDLSILHDGKIASAITEAYHETAWIHHKYDGGAPSACTSRHSTARNHTEGLHRRGVMSHHMLGIDLQIGTPPQTIRVLVDTGSSDLVLPLDTCSTCSGAAFHPKDSTTFKNKQYKVGVEYEDGCKIRGVPSSDMISFDNLPSIEQGFIGATKEVRGQLRVEDFSGLLGLGFSRHDSASFQMPYFKNLISKGALKAPHFSLYLKSPSDIGEKPSSLCMGCIDVSRISGGSLDLIQYYPLVPESTRWNLASSGFFFNGVKRTNSFVATVDSAASWIHLPTDLAEEFYTQIEDALRVDETFFVFPCKTKLPDISIAFGADDQFKLHAIDPKHFSLSLPGTSYCLGTVVDSGRSYVVLGGSFMKGWYTIFDLGSEEGSSRIGFAPAA